MAITSAISLRGYFTGLLSGSRAIAPGDIGSNDAPAQVIQLILASGANTILIPTNARGCLIVFAPTSSTIKTLKGVTGDTGIVLAPNFWSVLTFSLPTPPASFVINSSALDTTTTEITFF